MANLLREESIAAESSSALCLWYVMMQFRFSGELVEVVPRAVRWPPSGVRAAAQCDILSLSMLML